jgi:hypothetical protein
MDMGGVVDVIQSQATGNLVGTIFIHLLQGQYVNPSQRVAAFEKLNGTIDVPGKFHIKGDDAKGLGFRSTGTVAPGKTELAWTLVMPSRTRQEYLGRLKLHRLPSFSIGIWSIPKYLVRFLSNMERSLLTFSAEGSYLCHETTGLSQG